MLSEGKNLKGVFWFVRIYIYMAGRVLGGLCVCVWNSYAKGKKEIEGLRDRDMLCRYGVLLGEKLVL